MMNYRAGLAYILAGSTAAALTTSLYLELWHRHSWLPYPKIGFLFEPLAQARWFAPLLTALVFCLVGLGLPRGHALIPRANTVFLSILTLLQPVALIGQWGYVRDQLYRLHVVDSIATIVLELIGLGSVWIMWVVARRSSTLRNRTAFTWFVTVYFINLWTGSGFILEGP